MRQERGARPGSVTALLTGAEQSGGRGTTFELETCLSEHGERSGEEYGVQMVFFRKEIKEEEYRWVYEKQFLSLQCFSQF